MKRAEIIIAIFTLISLVLNLFLIPGGSVLTVVTLSTLSILYLYLSFALFNDIRFRNIFNKDSYKGISTLRIIGAVGTGMALSITTVGILFRFQSWPGSGINLLLGCMVLAIIMLISLMKYQKNKSPYYTNIFIRIAVVGGIGLLLFLIPTTSWIDFKYRNHPSYANALKKSMADPGNKDLQERVKMERGKMIEGK